MSTTDMVAVAGVLAVVVVPLLLCLYSILRHETSDELELWPDDIGEDPIVRARRHLEAHPDAWLAQPGRPCGDGATCPLPGQWGLRGYHHAYCPRHATERLERRQP